MTGSAVLCVGRLYADVIFTGAPRLPTAGTEVFADGVEIHAGGGAAITAGYLAALGRTTFLAAHLPGAPFDAAVTDELTELAVDLRFTRTDPDRTDPQMTVAITTAGDRAFLTHDAGPAAPELSPDALRTAGIEHLHIGELRTLVACPGLLPLARQIGATVSLDCGWDDGFDAAIGDLIAQVDVFLPNADEMRLLEGLGLSDRPAPLTVIKCGADGARIAGGPVRPAQAVRAVDTTGAGDAFNGGFLHAWLARRDPEACLEAGITCGAHAVAATGGATGARFMRGARDGQAAAQ